MKLVKSSIKDKGDFASLLAQIEHYKMQLEAIMKCSYDGIYIADGQGNPINMNESFAQLIGVNREELHGLHTSELVAKGYIPESVVLEVLKQKQQVTKMINYRTGRETIVTGVPVFNQQGKITLVICNLRDLTELKKMERELEDNKKLTDEYRRNLASLYEKTDDLAFISQSHEMDVIKNIVNKVAKVDANVLITGETGVGKDVIARLVHQLSSRADTGSFVKVDCAAIPEQLLEAELFGYEKGSFTDARKSGKIGRIELAQNGTLFLDEIGELPLRLQVKLLNVLQEHKITRIGGLHPRKINFRVISATNRNLEQMIKNKEFREDLYFRLNVVKITVPPLRERKDDILPLSNYFLDLFNNKYNLAKKIDSEVIEYLKKHDWPGNVRELANIIEQMVVLSSNQNVKLVDLPDKISKNKKLEDDMNTETDLCSRYNLKTLIDEYEKKIIQNAIHQTKTLKEAANQLGIDISTLTRKRIKYKL